MFFVASSPDHAFEREPERNILMYLSTGSAARKRQRGAQQKNTSLLGVQWIFVDAASPMDKTLFWPALDGKQKSITR